MWIYENFLSIICRTWSHLVWFTWVALIYFKLGNLRELKMAERKVDTQNKGHAAGWGTIWTPLGDCKNKVKCLPSRHLYYLSAIKGSVYPCIKSTWKRELGLERVEILPVVKTQCWHNICTFVFIINKWLFIVILNYWSKSICELEKSKVQLLIFQEWPHVH